MKSLTVFQVEKCFEGIDNIFDYQLEEQQFNTCGTFQQKSVGLVSYSF